MHAGRMDPHRALRHALAAALAAVLTLSGTAAPADAAPRKTTTTLKVSHTSIRKGEMVWLKGKVKTRSGKAVKGVKVRLERKAPGGSWKRFATLKTRKDGSFSQRQQPAKSYTYRARTVKTSKYAYSRSPNRAVKHQSSDRKLGPRAKELRSTLGKGKHRVRTISVKGTERVRYRSYKKGMLVEVKKPDKKYRTWLVYGDIYRAYVKAGGPKGKLGVPIADPKCGLMEAGCVQRFSKGAIYDNKNTKGVVAKTKGRKAQVLAVALSQAGYTQTRKNDTKYNRWVGSVGQAWCSSFLSWVSRAAGSKAIPKHKRLKGLLKDIRQNKVMKTGSKPKVGALVFFDTFDDGVVEATHVGIVTKVKSNTILTVEANTSNPKNSAQRGVYKKERQRSRALFYAYPEY